ncbi:MAG: RtcB family protein [Deltaproteobacteria bacterium]|nr:RtcB family protein [Candidatus Anaeroferrophillacea bacterium]
METGRYTAAGPDAWRREPTGAMRVPIIIYADREQLRAMDDKVDEQLEHVAGLPGIVNAAYAMPDAHWGYGFPIGGVAAFDADAGGVVSAGGVGFDISCGVRTMLTGVHADEIRSRQRLLADRLAREIPAGVGSRGFLHLKPRELDEMLAGGARWAVGRGYGVKRDLERIEERGCMAGAEPEWVSERAKKRQQDEVGTLGSGNHYLEVQEVVEIFAADAARAFGLRCGDAVVTLHCGSRGLGHQIGTEFLREMATAAGRHGIVLPDRELACVPVQSETGRRYLGAMAAAVNCALANRQVLTHLVRGVFAELLPAAEPDLLYDVSHNTCKKETHLVDGHERQLHVHRKGATRSFGPKHSSLPPELHDHGQPVLIGGTMGTSSYILAGLGGPVERAFSSACHGAGRTMSRRQACKRWRGRAVMDELERRGIIVRGASFKGLAEEAPGAYKDIDGVVAAAETAGLARRVARVTPLICIKG